MRKCFFALVLALLTFSALPAEKKASGVVPKAARDACENFLNDYTFAKYLKATIVDGSETKTFYVRAADVKGFTVQTDGFSLIFSKDALEDAREIAYVPYSACTVFEYRTGVLVLNIDGSRL